MNYHILLKKDERERERTREGEREKESRRTHRQIDELFRLLDDDDDGSLGRAEMQAGFERLAVPVCVCARARARARARAYVFVCVRVCVCVCVCDKAIMIGEKLHHVCLPVRSPVHQCARVCALSTLNPDSQ